MGRAIRYLLKNFRELGRFLRFATIAPDNNVAEASLRRIALGRGNYLFFGNGTPGTTLPSSTPLLLRVKNTASTRSPT